MEIGKTLTRITLVEQSKTAYRKCRCDRKRKRKKGGWQRLRVKREAEGVTIFAKPRWLEVKKSNGDVRNGRVSGVFGGDSAPFRNPSVRRFNFLRGLISTPPSSRSTITLPKPLSRSVKSQHPRLKKLIRYLAVLGQE